MRNGPLVSAIIPTYNRADLVREAIDSVRSQTYQNVEVIVVDDGSTDDTLASLKRYGSRIRVVSQSNAGPSAARNHGIRVSNGQLVAFLDSDDLWLPTKIERQVALLEKAGTSVPCCLSNITMRWADREFTSFAMSWLDPAVTEGIWLNADEVLATRFVLFNQGVMIRRPVLQTIGGFDESLRLLEDAELSMRLSLEGPWAFIQEPLVIWRESSVSCYQESRRDEIGSQEPMIKILAGQLARLNDSDEHETLRKYLNGELKSLRRQFKAAELSKKSFWGALVASKLIRRVERYRRAAFRRSPWFPKMKVEAVASWRGRQTHRDVVPLTDPKPQDSLPASLQT